jgi:hypothetical protein
MRAKEHTKRHALTTEVSSPTEAPVTDIKTCTIGMIHLKAFFFWKSLNALHVTSKIAMTFSELSQSLNLAKRGWVSRSVPVFRLYMTRDSAKSDGKFERDESEIRCVTDIKLSEFRLEVMVVYCKGLVSMLCDKVSLQDPESLPKFCLCRSAHFGGKKSAGSIFNVATSNQTGIRLKGSLQYAPSANPLLENGLFPPLSRGPALAL